MKTKSFIIFFFAVSVVYSQSQKQQLKLSDCISLALGKNPTLQISQAKLQAAEARLSEAGSALLPQLKLSGRVTELSEIDPYALKLGPPINLNMTLFPSITENYSLKLTLQQPLFTGFRLKKNREIAELNTNVAREDLTKEQSDLVLNVVTAYWNLYRAMQTEEVIRQSIEQITEHLKDVKNYFQQGMATDTEVMKVQVQLSDVKVRLIESQNAVRLANMALNSLIRNPLDIEIDIIDTLENIQKVEENLMEENLSELQLRALKNRPELKSMQLHRDISNASVTAAKSGWYPQIFLAANYDYARPNQRIIPPKDRWDATWDIGINLQWNIWDWNITGHQTAQAEASLRQTEAGLIQVSDAIALEVAQQYFNTRAVKEKISVTSSAVVQAQESFRIAYEKFKNGITSNTELLDAEIALLQAKLSHTHAVVDYKLSLTRLRKAVGESL